MGALKIDCYCNETQMSKIISLVVDHLHNSDSGQVPDLDDMIDDIRVCVEFETYMDTLSVKQSEVLDANWDVLYEDTAVLTSRLRTILKTYNNENKKAIYQAHHIYQDRQSQL